jgi:hypothetical protein
MEGTDEEVKRKEKRNKSSDTGERRSTIIIISCM